MDSHLVDLLREIEGTAHQYSGAPRMAREAGQFLNLLVKVTRATHILEVGAADGYATLWLAEAAAATNGQVTTVESDVWKYEIARDVLSRSPHADRINLIQGDEVEVLPVLEGPFDFVRLDAERSRPLQYFRLLIERIASGAVICCDKAISKAAALAEYLTYVHERPGLESVLVPIGEGIELTRKAP